MSEQRTSKEWLSVIALWIIVFIPVLIIVSWQRVRRWLAS